MTPPDHVAVLDVGKTNVKLVLVEAATLSEVRTLSRPNRVLPGPPWPHYDTDGIWTFLLEGLRAFQAGVRVDAVTCSAHGASGVLMAPNGSLAAPVLDYEHDGPDALAAAYDALRPDFAETGSPRLPRGLNVGAQLHWMFDRDPGLLARVGQFVTWPQSWAGRLSGVWTTERSSLGAHTDLWNPARGAVSALVGRLGLSGRMAPLRPAGTMLGPVLAEVARITGLAPDTRVVSGLHDSNASLYPHLAARRALFAVVSTGTWTIAMAVGGTATLDPARDTLVNVDANGAAVPSARFMGGREFETLCGPDPVPPSAAEVARVLADGVMCLPSFETTSGPFPGRTGRWSHDPASLSPGEITAAASLYLGLMTATCLALIGARGPVIVEGPFTRNALYLDMLAVASRLDVLAPEAASGTAIGSAILAGAAPKPLSDKALPRPAQHDTLDRYAEVWNGAVARGG